MSLPASGFKRDIARWTLSRYGFASNQRMIGFLEPTSGRLARLSKQLRHPSRRNGNRFHHWRGQRYSTPDR